MTKNLCLIFEKNPVFLFIYLEKRTQEKKRSIHQYNFILDLF